MTENLHLNEDFPLPAFAVIPHASWINMVDNTF